MWYDVQTTLGYERLIIGQTKLFVADAWLNGLPWDLTLGQVNLLLLDPTGTETSIQATVLGAAPQAAWIVANPVGQWTRCWDLMDTNGLHQRTPAISFYVAQSP